MARIYFNQICIGGCLFHQKYNTKSDEILILSRECMKHNKQLALITGGTSGLGRALVIEFANRGYHVAFVGRNSVELDKTELLSSEYGNKVKGFLFDLSDSHGIQQLYLDILSEFSMNVDVLVNSAGIGILGNVDQVPLSEYERILKVNFFAPLALIQAVIPDMKQQRSGKIINITSGVGDRGLPGVSPYCASKFCLNAISESVRIELCPYGISVLSVSPGLFISGFSAGIKVHGSIMNTFTSGRQTHINKIAKRIIKASEKSKRVLRMSVRTRLGYHLNYWSPKLLDRLLKKTPHKELYDDN